MKFSVVLANLSSPVFPYLVSCELEKSPTWKTAAQKFVIWDWIVWNEGKSLGWADKYENFIISLNEEISADYRDFM